MNPTGKNRMNVWLCPVKPKSWRTIRAAKIFGAPKHAYKTMSHVRLGDLLIFHVLKPANGIVAVCRVASEVYEDYQDIWGKDRYPLRARIDFIPKLQRDENNPIPLSSFFGNTTNKEVKVEPYLRNIWITISFPKSIPNTERPFCKQNVTQHTNYKKSRSSSASQVSSQSVHMSTASTITQITNKPTTLKTNIKPTSLSTTNRTLSHHRPP
jgi:hypothetical protein